MKSLPQFQSDDRTFQLMQSQWGAIINTLLRNPIASGVFLHSVVLSSGANVVNHRLGRKLTGWIVTRMEDSYADIYDTQNSNQRPDLTLLLNASAGTICDIYVF